MDIESVRRFCHTLPATTEDIQWGDELLFRIGRKIFAMASLDAAASVRLSFKCTPEEFAELTERLGIIPAPYVARYHWVALEQWDALPAAELKRRIQESYELVRDKLPAKVRARILRRRVSGKRSIA
ncbi:MAG: MmcQ/YjbR family DNA-binding protein [Candidatus Solibacter usitatus]|nr:MmcQ/YjbR family DNA-binding protein [Candidatus Solibacter usitatus]